MVNIAVIGMGGFAASHHEAVKELEANGLCRLICACDPNPQAFEEQMLKWNLQSRGVRIYDDYIRMLDACKGELNIVTIPTPIPLHAPMHRACVERGLAVYLEKPPTLDYSELNNMLAVEESAEKLTNVGFNFIIETDRQKMKQRILSGEFGRLLEVHLFGNWPRTDAYFNRNNWAGRLLLDGSLVLDSIMGNAMAHYVHNVLFWAGLSDQWSWAGVENVRADLYRANSIEGTDTVLMDIETDSEVDIRIALTHACGGVQKHYERLVCENAVIDYYTYDRQIIRWSDGREEVLTIDNKNLLYENIAQYIRYVEGREDRPVTRLADCIPFVQINDLAYIASGQITTVDASFVQEIAAEGQMGTARQIFGISEVCSNFLQNGSFPYDQGLPWASENGSAVRADLPKLRDVIEKMVDML